MHDKAEVILRKAAKAMRLEAEKKRAQRERRKDAKAFQKLDGALQAMSDRRIRGGDDKWKGDRVVLQRQAKSRGFLKQGADGKHRFGKGKVDRNDRPAEKLVRKAKHPEVSM